MRKYAEWMVLADDRILEFLETEGPASPSEIANDERFHFSTEYIGRRCRDNLLSAGLVRRVGQGVYVITDEGRAYLEGDLDASDLPSPPE